MRCRGDNIFNFFFFFATQSFKTLYYRFVLNAAYIHSFEETYDKTCGSVYDANECLICKTRVRNARKEANEFLAYLMHFSTNFGVGKRTPDSERARRMKYPLKTNEIQNGANVNAITFGFYNKSFVFFNASY